MYLLDKLPQLNLPFTFLQFRTVSYVCKFFVPLEVGILFLQEVLHEVFFLLEGVNDAVDFGLCAFDGFLKFDEDFFLFFVKTEINIDEFVFFDELLGGFDVFFFHF